MFGAVKPGFRSLATLKLVVNVVGELALNQKEQMQHRAVSLRQHSFLVYDMYKTSKSPVIMADATSCRKSKMAANQPQD